MSESVRIFDGTAGTTFSQNSTDTAQSLTASGITNAGGAIITVETNSVRYAFTATPTQAGLGHLATAGTVIVLNSGSLVKNFKFISAVAATHGTLQISPLV